MTAVHLAVERALLGLVGSEAVRAEVGLGLAREESRAQAGLGRRAGLLLLLLLVFELVRSQFLLLGRQRLGRRRGRRWATVCAWIPRGWSLPDLE